MANMSLWGGDDSLSKAEYFCISESQFRLQKTAKQQNVTNIALWFYYDKRYSMVHAIKCWWWVRYAFFPFLIRLPVSDINF